MKMTSLTRRSCSGALCVLLAATAGPSALAQTVIDFEDPSYVPGLLQESPFWTVAGTNELVLTATDMAANLTAAGLEPGATVHGGSQAALFSHAGSGGGSVCYIDGLSLARFASLTAWARPLTPRTDGATNLGNIFLTMEDAGGVRAAAFRFGFTAVTRQPHIDYATAGTDVWKDTGVPWTSNTWYQITMSLNYTAKTYDFFINGTKINAEPIVFYGGNNSESLWQIRIYRGSNQAGMILDDISVTDLTPVGPFAGGATGTTEGWSFQIWDAADGATPNTSTIAVKVDGASVTPTSITQSGNIGTGDGTGLTTVAYQSATPIFHSGSTHTLTVDYQGAGFPNVQTNLVFTVPCVKHATDRVAGYPAEFQGVAKYSPSGSGHSGAAGDFAVDIGAPARQSNNLMVADPAFLDGVNSAALNDTLTFSLWVKHRITSSSSVFWAFSDSAPDNRGAQMHCPYYSNQDGTVFFDTGGNAPENRISAKMTGFAAYDGLDSWWHTWHHIVAIKNGLGKQIWIDGISLWPNDEPAIDQAPLFNDITKLYLGCGISSGKPALSMDGWLDDFAVFGSALSEADVAALYAGQAPNRIGAAPSLLAWWDFNDAPHLTVQKVEGKVVITFTDVLQSSASLMGPYEDRFDITSPYTVVPGDEPQMFFRARK